MTTMPQSKVCILTTAHFYDDNRVYYKEVLSLKEGGHDIVYIAPEASKTNNQLIKCIDLQRNNNVIRRLLSTLHVFWIAKREKCDIYHFQDPELIFCGILLKLFSKSKVIYDVHEDYRNQMLSKHYLKSWMRKPLFCIMAFSESIADRLFDAIITADNFVSNYFKSNKTVMIYNYPQTTLLDTCISNTKKIDKQWDIIFPGSMAKFTANIIIEIARILWERGRQIKVLLISPFHFDGGVDWIIKRICSLGMDPDSFTLMDRIPPYNVPYYIQSSRIGIVPLPDTPKMRSNIPTKIFEYMYCGVPIVTGNLPPSAQYISRSNAGFLVDPNSPEDYADKIEELLSNPYLCEQMGLNGKQLVTRECNWRAEATKLLQLYDTLLKK